MPKKTLRQWDSYELFDALKAILIRQFGTIPTVGVVAGQAVASACYELLEIGAGPFKDLDVFVLNLTGANGNQLRPVFESDTQEGSALFYNSRIRSNSKLPIPTLMRTAPSQSDETLIQPLDKPGYQLLISYQSKQNPYWNVIELAPLDKTPFGAAQILDGFDINACCIALDLETQKVVWTDEFESFTFRPELEVINLTTPAHTALRLLRKHGELSFSTINVPVQMSILQQARALAIKCQPDGKDYLSGHLMTRETLLKNSSVFPLLKQYFESKKIRINFRCELDDLRGGLTPNMYVKSVYDMDVINEKLSENLKSQEVMLQWMKHFNYQPEDVVNGLTPQMYSNIESCYPREHINYQLNNFIRSRESTLELIEIIRRHNETSEECRLSEAIANLQENNEGNISPFWELWKASDFYSLTPKELGRDAMTNVRTAFRLGNQEGVEAYGFSSYCLCAKFLMKIVKNRKEVGVTQKSEARALYLQLCERGGDVGSGEKRSIDNRMIQYLLLAHPKLAGHYRKNLHNAIAYLCEQHPLLHNALIKEDGVMDDHRIFHRLAISAVRVKKMDKKKRRFVIGLYETQSQSLQEHEFPSLYADNFDSKIDLAVSSYLKSCKQDSFENPQALVDYLKKVEWLDPHSETVKICALSNHFDFIQLGEKYRHCVGGYYDEAKSMNTLILEALDYSGQGTVVEVSVRIGLPKDIPSDNKDLNLAKENALMVLRIIQNRGKDNIKPEKSLKDAFPEGEHLEVPWSQLPKEVQCVFSVVFNKFLDDLVLRKGYRPFAA